MNLNEINFPVYRLGTNAPSVEDNIIYYFFGKMEVVDDKNLPGDTLSSRRLKIPEKEKFKLKLAIFYIADLIKLSGPEIWFIDSSGKLFQYKKSRFCKLVSKKITNVIRCTGYSLIEVQGVLQRFICLYPPRPEEKYASLLVMDKSYMLYGFSQECHGTTRRKI